MGFDTIAPDELFTPTMRKRFMLDPYGLDVDDSEAPLMPPRAAWRERAIRQDEILSRGLSASNAYRPTLMRNGETTATTTTGGQQPAQNPYAARLEDVGNRLESAYAAPHAGTARQVIGALLSRRNPALGGLVSGETQRQRQIEPLQQEYGLLADIISRNRAQQTADLNIQNIGSEIGHRRAQEAYWNKLANVKENPPVEIPHVQQVGDKIMQWNPATSRFDIEVGPQKEKKSPAKVNYDQSIPVSVVDENGTTYDVNDPNLPEELKPIVKSARAAHSQALQEQADIATKKETAKNREALQKTVDDARSIDALHQEQATILEQAVKEGKKGPFGGGPYLNGPQSMQFLSNHMALTVGRIKGARTGRDLIEMHVRARDLDQATEALAQRVLAGGVLTYSQAQQMLGTTQIKRASAWQKVDEDAKDYGIDISNRIPEEFGGKASPAAGVKGRAPAGATMKVPGSDGKMHWSDGKQDLGVVE